MNEERRLIYSDLFEHDLCGPREVVVVVLNHQLPSWTPKLWERASTRVCADGGANRLHDQFPDATRPDFIVGDMDSVRPSVLDFYCMKGTEKLDLSHDQDTTDMQKCIYHVCNKGLEGENDDGACGNRMFVALGALGGRLDHTISNLSSLLLFRGYEIILVGDGNCARLISAEEKASILVDTTREGPGCALVPFGGPARVTSTGLKWNLDDQVMQLGALISTSNHVESDHIDITTDGDLLWITSVQL